MTGKSFLIEFSANFLAEGMQRLNKLSQYLAENHFDHEAIALRKLAGNLQIPKEVHAWIARNLTKLQMLTYESWMRHKDAMFQEPIEFKNPYSGELQKIPVVIIYAPNTPEAFYEIQKKVMVINSAGKDLTGVISKLKYIILHEITHAIDPKIENKELRQHMDKKESGPEFNNLNTAPEFDAYSNDLISAMVDQVSDKEIEMFLKSTHFVPKFSPKDLWQEVGFVLSEQRPIDERYRQFKLRLWDEWQKKKEAARARAAKKK